MDEQERVELKKVVEACLFSANEPLSLQKLWGVLKQTYVCDLSFLKELVGEIREEYTERDSPIELEEIGKGFLFRTRREYNAQIRAVLKGGRPDRLSPAASEVLAVIAYRQPVTRHQIEDVRGVDSSGPLATLIERDLVEAQGQLEAPGRPTLYGVTKKFFSHYGINKITDLPNYQLVRSKE